MKFLRFVLPIAIIALATAACGTAQVAPTGAAPASSAAAPAADGRYSASQAAWLAIGGCRPVAPGAASPAGGATNGPALLEVSGRFTAGHKEPVSLTLAALDRMPQVRCTVNDRQAEGTTVEFQGVLLSTLLSEIGARPSAVLHTAAANDYDVDLPVSDIESYPVLVATRVNGHTMTVARYGPVRVVYPTTGYHLDPTVYAPRWIWQLTSITVA